MNDNSERLQDDYPNNTAEEKEQILIKLIQSWDSVVVAFSGGVDSSYLADVAASTLKDGAHIVIADSPSIPRSELDDAKRLANSRGWRLIIVKTNEFDSEAYRRNDGTRCYHCKTELFRVLKEYAARNQVNVIAYGANLDDLEDPTRLGMKAASENSIMAPLQMARLSKSEIRLLSAKRGLPTAEKPSFACLASRFPKGVPVNPDDMHRIEMAEELLKKLGFRQYRVRHHNELCRIEVEIQDLPKFLESAVREEIVEKLRFLGYRFVTLDLAGYRTGSSA